MNHLRDQKHPGRELCAALPLVLLFLTLPSHASDDHLPLTNRADRVVVLKKAHTLTLLNHGKVLKEYKVALGGDPVGPKARQGDHKTPEGSYILYHRNDHSQFYRSIHISYPNAEDQRGRASWAPPRVAISCCTDCQTISVGLEGPIARATGPTAASP